jgi:hypothetical protein
MGIVATHWPPMKQIGSAKTRERTRGGRAVQKLVVARSARLILWKFSADWGGKTFFPT